MKYPGGGSSGGGGISVGSTTSDGTANTLLKTNGSGAVADASGVTHPATGSLAFNPGASDYAINVDRTTNTGSVFGVRIVSGDNNNVGANKALFIANSSEDRGVTHTYESTSAFITHIDSSSYRVTTAGGVGGREIRFQPGGASGAGSLDRMILPVKKDLVDNTTTSLYEVALPTLTGTGGVIKSTVFASDGVDVQSRSQVVRYTAVNKGGVYTTEIAVVSEAASVSAGTLTGTYTILNGANKVTIQFNGNSSLVPTTLWIHYTIESFSDQAITLL